MPINYSDYPADWKLRSRFIREYRARSRCEKCGVENGAPTGRGWKVVLTVAHLFDSDKKNGRFLNLAALCQKCHLNLDKYHHSDKRRGEKKPLSLPLEFSEREDSIELRKRKTGRRHPVSQKFAQRVRHERNGALWFLHPHFPNKKT